MVHLLSLIYYALDRRITKPYLLLIHGKNAYVIRVQTVPYFNFVQRISIQKTDI